MNDATHHRLTEEFLEHLQDAANRVLTGAISYEEKTRDLLTSFHHGETALDTTISVLKAETDQYVSRARDLSDLLQRAADVVESAVEDDVDGETLSLLLRVQAIVHLAVHDTTSRLHFMIGYLNNLRKPELETTTGPAIESIRTTARDLGQSSRLLRQARNHLVHHRK